MKPIFSLLKSEAGKVVGFSLESGGETCSEIFCKSVAVSISRNGTAAIRMEPEKITFSASRPYSVRLSKEQSEALSQLLANPQELNLYAEPYSSSVGFRVVLSGEENKRLNKVKIFS